MVEYKKFIGFILISSLMLLFLVSCGTEDEPGFIEGLLSKNVDSGASLDDDQVDVDSEQTELEEELEEEVVGVLANTCKSSDECEWNEHCIESECGKVTDIYDTTGDCEKKCNFNNVLISTSDGEELTLSRGQGSYTSAGALEWKLLSSADYCLGDDATPVAIELIMKNLGVVKEEKVVILNVGDESGTIKHPDLASVSFQMTVESYDETCSVE